MSLVAAIRARSPANLVRTDPSGAKHIRGRGRWVRSLDGRPVVMVRSNFDLAWNRAPEPQGDTAFGNYMCRRNGVASNCGVNYLVTDHIGKPIAMMDASGRLVGTGEYDAFGHVNRLPLWSETPHPYPNNIERHAIADWVAPDKGISMRARVHLDLVDTEACREKRFDPAHLLDGDTGAVLDGPYGGYHLGDQWTDWVRAPAGGHFELTFSSNWKNMGPPNASAPLPAPQACMLGDDGWPYSGVTAREYEYQRYEPGVPPLATALPLWTPFRFPGQYHDAETDLFENWNRYYDPSIGRYLQPEPELQRRTVNPLDLGTNAGWVEQLTLPTYAYARNNPIANMDADGLGPRAPGTRKPCPRANAPAGAVLVDELNVNDPLCKTTTGVAPAMCAPSNFDSWSAGSKCAACLKVADSIGGSCGKYVIKAQCFSLGWCGMTCGKQ